MPKQGLFKRVLVIFVWAVSALLFHIIIQTVEIHEETKEEMRESVERVVTMDEVHDRTNMFLIFIGGMPRSGTTLMRTMLDAHTDIRCGQETHVIPDLLLYSREWTRNAQQVGRMTQAGIYPEALDNAMSQFILEIIIGHGPGAEYLCNKDPYTMEHVTYLHKLFPNAKFIFMIRDGRAFAHSVISRAIPIGGMDTKSYRGILPSWNSGIESMFTQCQALGESICLPVYYEQLVLQPVSNTKRIFEFLGISWQERVLHHEQHINETKLSKFECSTSQVKKPLYLDALRSWFGKIPKDVERDMGRLAPMLEVLGYDPYNPTPKYGEPDDFVLSLLSREEKESVKKRRFS